MFYYIIVPCFNSEKTISRALKSIYKQTFKNYEIIIVDDGSKDQTSQIINDFFVERSIDYNYIYQKNKGPSFCRNLAMRLSKSKYISFIDADD